MGSCGAANYQDKDISLGMPLERIYELRKSICKVIYEEKNKIESATGFFMIFNNNKYLITTYSLINENKINKTVDIEVYNKNKIEIELSNRDIKFFKHLYITMVEIKYSDEIYKDAYTLSYDLNYVKGYNQYENFGIFSLQYPKNEIESASGKITEINLNDEFKHNIYVQKGSEGSPIISLNNFNVIGMHRQGDKSGEAQKIGSFIGQIFKYINNNYIIGEIYISKENIGKNIEIINSYDEFIRKNESLNNSIKEEQRNEKDIKESVIIEINNIKIPFSYFHKFEQEGNYQIKYIFNNPLKNCNLLFYNCTSLIKLDLSQFISENTISMWGMFWNCSSLKEINLSNFNTQNVTDMKDMFQDCFALTKLDLSSFNTENVINICGMFHNCPSLKELDLSNFNTKKVKLMCGVFHNCSSLAYLNVSSFNTENVINMVGIFYGCSSLIHLIISNFNTENVINMNDMFKDCSSLIDLDLSSFNTQNVSTMLNMFSGCSSLTKLNLSNFNTQNTANMQGLFDNCEAFRRKSIITDDIKILNEMNGIN